MITPNDLSSYIKAKPFRPFRIQMASGETFDVRHPEMARVGRTSVISTMIGYLKFGEYINAEPFRPFLIKMASGQIRNS